MPLSNAERQANWRARNKIVKVVDFDPPHLEPLVKLPDNSIFYGVIKCNETKANYKASLKLMFKDYWNNDLSDDHLIFNVLDNKSVKFKDVAPDFNFLNNIDGRTTIIKYKRHAINVLNLLRRMRGFANYQKQIIPYREWLSQNYESKRQEVKLPPISFEYEDIMKVFNSIDNIDEKIIYGLLMLIPPRRIGDYVNTIIVHTKEEFDGLPKVMNYYYDGKIYIYNTKVDNRTFVTSTNNEPIFIVDVPPEVIAIINHSQNFLINKGIRINQLFEKYHNYKYTNANIRRLYVTHHLKAAIKYKDVKDTANAMGHSVEQNLKYLLQLDIADNGGVGR